MRDLSRACLQPESTAWGDQLLARPCGCLSPPQTASAEMAAFGTYQGQICGGRRGQKLCANRGQSGQFGLGKVALQLRPNPRQQCQIAGLSRNQTQPREDANDPKRPL